MSTSYMGEVRLVGYVFAPSGWAFCDGTLLPISEFNNLFVLLGTTYGGNGQTDFAVPDLRGRVPVHQGQSPGGSNYVIGQMGGVESVTLNVNQIPSHNHMFQCNPNSSGGSATPANNTVSGGRQVYRSSAPVEPMNPGMLSSVGNSQPHDNVQPFQAMNWIISLFGIFPNPG